MLRLNNQNRSNHYNNNSVLSGQVLATCNASSISMYQKLAALSQRKQWILFTSQCPRPVQSELSQYDINCSNIIHMKPSSVSTEEEIVIKAIKARTASAVVASSELSYHSKARIFECAAEYQCEVFFLNNNPYELTDTRH